MTTTSIPKEVLCCCVFLWLATTRIIPKHHVASFMFQTAPHHQQRQQQQRPFASHLLLLATRPQDLELSFGSANQTGVSWGEDEDDQLQRTSDLQTVSQLLKEQSMHDKDERKLELWGTFANVTNKNDLQAAIAEERRSTLQQFDKKAMLAQQSGVTLDVLEPRLDDTNGGVWSDSNGNVQITAGSAAASSTSWITEMDDELSQEWNTLVGQQQQPQPPQDGNTNDSISSGNNNDIVQADNGKRVVREKLSGVRVGSAGGWELEVFPGDFVVHRKYGIGRFEQTTLRSKTKLSEQEKKAQGERRAKLLQERLRALQKERGNGGVTPQDIEDVRSQFGTSADTDPVSNPQTTVLELSYADATVHVPVDRAYRLSRYRAGDSIVKPKLSRVRGEAWSKAKQRVEENTLALAQDVLALYATRETLARPPFDPQKEGAVQVFEHSFPFDPTPDQIKCFEDVENDMVWRRRPMDRLVCGDVGFGKTEVAFRALFRCVENGKQAALLAPTGVLAAQHYKNIVKRMGPGTKFNLTVSLLRGGSAVSKAGREIRANIQNGTTQLVVGTHALLSNSIEFNDLGLLVVDEEQRFGVKQKERLKLICNGVDVLTLSATPIPRTLQMSLSGIRDTSTIRSPPPMRKPTVTYVQEFSESMVRKAIQDELDRGGQCFYVVPRISMLEDAEATIQRLFPKVRIIQAHGRMQRNGAEENVAAFAEGNFDVLLATTVIENGVDIPSVNTIIVQDSQVFGMSTLYQLRGRVGRSDKQACAYFLHKAESVTEQAVMRLQAIGELSELGSGFDVANRDLEIRGAGSLLGTEQSGMAAKVGFDLYMRMLKKSIRQLRGLDLPIVPRTNVLFPTPGTPGTFAIPETFIEDSRIRSTEAGKGRLAESTAALVNLTNTWKNEYGPLPAKLQSQLKTLHLHACTRRLGIDLVGLVTRYTSDDEQVVDCVLRSPGLRPRHWATVIEHLPKKIPPRGFDVVFPERFSASGDELVIEGGKKLDLKSLLSETSYNEDREEEEWDAMDQEDIEAMKDISSSVNVTKIDDVDVEYYPRLVVKDFGGPKNAVDKLLKLLLPVAKIVYEKQEEQAESAKTAAALRERQNAMRMRKKKNAALEAKRKGYRY